ncbi:hypothetical protein C366_06011 [Cryptococcus neoformans Tu401-1]|nr:hypothetical protein C365_05939 [Cryptococcus neoformans var. grubii Bt85]OXG12286.1 hypothetical protein C366_06011 [Cryptococcus neoformans var. grubii Tu401-1]
MGPLSPLKGQVATSQTENWDDDFEFSLSPPKDYNKSTATLKENKYQTIYDKNRDTPSLVRPKSLSLSPTKPTHSDAPSCPKVPAPLHTPCPQSPRHSPSYPNDLTSLSSKSKPSLSNLDPVSPPLLSTRPNPSIPQRHGQGFRSRARSTTAINGYVTPKKLTKRHPSASFVPIRSSHSSRSLRQNDSTASLSCSLHRCATCPDAMYPCTPPSTTDIPGSASGEPMSPLLLSEKVASGVADLLRKRSRTKSRPRMPPLPFSDDTAGKEHRKRLWNRFSGNPSSNTDHIAAQMRRRSSSLGAFFAEVDASVRSSPEPPLPPLPVNLNSRSPSTTSSISISSTHSQIQHNTMPPISSTLQSSSNSLAKTKRGSKGGAVPLPYNHPGNNGCKEMAIDGEGSPLSSCRNSFTTHDQPQCYSRGFHLPSPSLGSPYRRARKSLHIPEHPLPESSSFHIMAPGQTPAGNASICYKTRSGSPSEANIIDDKVPRKLVKEPHLFPPVSSVKMAEKLGNDDEVLAMTNARPSTTGDCPAAGTPDKLNAVIAYPKLVGFGRKTSGNGQTGTGASFTSTVRRLGSISKKHGRRISGGWKFGPQSSSSSASLTVQAVKPTGAVFDQSRAEKEAPLGTIIGSPMKKNVKELAEDELDKQAMGPECSESGGARQPRWSPPSEQWDHDFPHIESEFQHTEPSINGNSLIRTENRRREDRSRRQSWNDFVIPRNVMEKQRGVKEGIGAIKMFARGVESLKSLMAAHTSLSNQLYSHKSSPDSLKFDALHAEFAQWWEMAIVLVEVGSTGRDDNSHGPIDGPKRERRVTLATEEARIAEDTPRHVSGSITSIEMSSVPSQGELTALGHHNISFPDTVEHPPSPRSPPRASPPPEHWRASTGRQNLSKRQLEVLRTMLRTPVSESSKGSGMAGQQESSQWTDYKAINATKAQKDCNTSIEVTSTTPKSQNDLPVGTDPLQARCAEPFNATIKSRRRHTNKVGLAGLKEFLRTLRVERSTDKANGQKFSLTAVRPQAPAREDIEAVTGANRLSRSDINSSTATERSALLEPPLSFRSASSSGDSCEVSHNSVSARNLQTEPSFKQPLMPDKPQSKPFSRVRQIPSTASPSVLSKSTQNPRLEPRRPSIRNIFRTSSGNWSELISPNSGSPGPLSNKNSSPILRKSGSMRRTLEQVSEAKNRPKRGEKMDKDSAEAKAAMMGPSKGRDEPPMDGRGLISIGDPPVGTYIHSTPPTEISATVKQLRVEEEMTLKPGKKSRATGLGWPERKAKGDINDFISPVFSGIPSITQILSTSMTHPAALTVKELEQQDDSEGNVVVALTPDNLPTLLEYMRQCEVKLHEWKEKVQMEGLDKGLIMSSVKA